MVEVSVPSSKSSVSSRRLAVHALGTLNTAASSPRGGSQRSEATRRPVGECGEMWASSRQCGRLRPETGRTAKKLGVACPKTGPRRVSWAGRHMGLNWAGRWTGLGVAQLRVGEAFI